MKNGFFVMFLLAAVSLTGCSPKKVSIEPMPTQSPQPPKPSCGSSNDFSVPNSNVIRQTVNLKKERQRVLRKNCEGNVHSDKIETVKDPNQYITITANDKFKGVDSSDIGWHLNNRTTCDGTSRRSTDTQVLSWNKAPTYSFHVDSSPTVFYVHVQREKINYIDYKISVCKPKSRIEKGVDACDAEIKEQGTLVLTVHYAEEELPGVLEKNPTVEECKRLAKP